MSESPRPSGECRCTCGSLLARRVQRGVELKCRRCKRTLVLPLPDAPPSAGSEAAWTPLEVARRAP